MQINILFERFIHIHSSHPIQKRVGHLMKLRIIRDCSIIKNNSIKFNVNAKVEYGITDFVDIRRPRYTYKIIYYSPLTIGLDASRPIIFCRHRIRGSIKFQYQLLYEILNATRTGEYRNNRRDQV